MYYCQHLDNIGQAFCSRLDVLNKLFDSVKEVLWFMYYKAIVKWISKQNGGRVSPPPEGTRYCPLIKIDNFAENPDWSIDFVCTKLNKDTMFIEFTSLSEEAPLHLLSINEVYGIYEGKKKVAELKLI